MKEAELYGPMRQWLEQYLKDKYKGYTCKFNVLLKTK